MVFICRLCSKYELTSSGLAIFGEVGTKKSLAYKIKLTVDVVVSQDDPLPKYVCIYCLGKLEEVFSFQESCRRAQLQLRDYFLRGSVQLVENDTASFEGLCNTNVLSSGISTCDTAALSTTDVEADLSQKCQELGAHVRIVSSVDSSSHMHDPVQPSTIFPDITTVTSNTDTSLIPYVEKDDFSSQSILRNDAVEQNTRVLQSSGHETQDVTGLGTSTLEICIKEEEVDLGCDYFEPEGSMFTSDKDVIGDRLQSATTNALPSKLKVVDIGAAANILETNRSVESVVTEEVLISSNGKSTPSFQDMIPGRSQDNKDDDICVVEIVKANKTSVAQYWERYESYFRCKKCLKVFLRKSKCENHIRTHLGVKPYECHICKQRFRKKRLLNEHNFVHSGKKLYQCILCSKTFRFKNNFQRHTRKHPESAVTGQMCELCGKVFKSQWKYWYHKTSKHVLVNADIVID